jgi:PAS domain S-box-containing protein
MIKKIQAVDARTAISSGSDNALAAAVPFYPPNYTSRKLALLQAVNQCRHVLVRAVEAKHLLEDICRTLVDTAAYQMAWIGSALPEESKKNRRAQLIHYEAGYPEKSKDIWVNGFTRQPEKAIRSRQPQVVQDVSAPLLARQWHLQATRYSFAAVVSLPLCHHEQVLGTITLYAKEKNAFEAEEVDLLLALADDIAYSLHQLRKRIARQQTIQQLHSSEKYFHALLEHASAMVMVVNTQGIPAFISPSVQRMLGYHAGTAGKPLTAYVHPDDKQAVEALLHTVSLEAGVQKTEARFRHEDGSWLYFDCSISNQLQEPDIRGLVVNLHDITLLKEAEGKLKRQQQEQQIMFDSVPALITFKDTYNRILRANRMAASFYNLSKAEIEGKTLYELNPLFAAKYHKEDIEIITSGIARLNITEKVLLPGGQTKWLQTNKIPYYNEQGETTGIIIFAQEITAQRTTEEELRTALEELKWRNHELDNYFYKVSHDLRAPLCSIEGLIHLMKTEQNVELNTQYLDLIERSVYKLDNFIKTILNHSNALHSPSRIAEIDFSHIVAACLDDLGYVAGQAKVKIALNVDSGCSFYNDATRIAIIFKHLISNSLKFFNPYARESYLHIHVLVSQARALITLEDNGIGIEKKYLPKVFNMFFKATNKPEGSGLGLYVVKQAIEKLGGSISVKSECGKGTTFKLVLANFQV